MSEEYQQFGANWVVRPARPRSEHRGLVHTQPHLCTNILDRNLHQLDKKHDIGRACRTNPDGASCVRIVVCIMRRAWIAQRSSHLRFSIQTMCSRDGTQLLFLLA